MRHLITGLLLALSVVAADIALIKSKSNLGLSIVPTDRDVAVAFLLGFAASCLRHRVRRAERSQA